MYLYEVKNTVTKGIVYKQSICIGQNSNNLNVFTLDPQSSALPDCATPRCNCAFNLSKLPINESSNSGNNSKWC